MNILIEQEIALHKFTVRQNPDEVVRLIHPSFREVGKSGATYDYQSIVEMMSSERAIDGYIHAQDFECIQLEPSIQLLLYKSALVEGAGKVSHYSKRSSIWAFTGERWQMKYHQGTSCPEFKFTSNALE